MIYKLRRLNPTFWGQKLFLVSAPLQALTDDQNRLK